MLFHYHHWTPYIEQTEAFYVRLGFRVSQRIGKYNAITPLILRWIGMIFAADQSHSVLLKCAEAPSILRSDRESGLCLTISAT